jgi:hypothetical protein
LSTLVGLVLLFQIVYGARVIVAVPDSEGVFVLVAVTVTVCPLVITAGAL